MKGEILRGKDVIICDNDYGIPLTDSILYRIESSLLRFGERIKNRRKMESELSVPQTFIDYLPLDFDMIMRIKVTLEVYPKQD